jgi:tetrahydromethanopterin S-methyltransferase subunit E
VKLGEIDARIFVQALMAESVEYGQKAAVAGTATTFIIDMTTAQVLLTLAAAVTKAAGIGEAS